MVGTSKKEAGIRLDLLEFTDQLATLVETGVSVGQALNALGDVRAPYGQAARKMRDEIENYDSSAEPQFYMPEDYYIDLLHNPGAYPKLVQQLEQAGQQGTALLPSRSLALSEAMAKEPSVFPAFLTALVRAGEYRGMLDVTLRRAQALLDKEWELICRRPKGEAALVVLLPSDKPLVNDWLELTAYQQQQLLAVSIRTFGVLLVSGVPILQAMDTVSTLLPGKQSAGWMGAREAVKRGDPITPAFKDMAIFPPFCLALIAVGEEGGFLDTSLERAADLIEREMARNRLATVH